MCVGVPKAVPACVRPASYAAATACAVVSAVPWFALDGTHPEVQAHLTGLFRTMRQEWGCTYFKLDANFWGAMHGGRLHDPKATRIEA